MRFTAFDFETCNGYSLSAVELGVAVYELKRTWRLVETRSWRFHPVKDEFWDRCTQINQIYRDQVVGLPGLIDSWGHIEPYFRDTLLVAHNASFDVRVLRAHLDHGQIERPNSVVHCTMALGGKFIQGADGGRLSDFCRLLSIPLQHHNATSDAVAAGKLYAHMHDLFASHQSWNSNLIRLSDLPHNGTSAAEIPPSRLTAKRVEDAPPITAKSVEPPRAHLTTGDLDHKAMLCFQILEACQTSILSDWAVALTGDMAIQRNDLVTLLKRRGARCGGNGQFYGSGRNPDGPTNTLIVSSPEMAEISEGKSPTKKLKEALAVHARGEAMRILSEEQLYDEIIQWYERTLPSDSIMRIKSFTPVSPLLIDTKVVMSNFTARLAGW